MATARVSKNGRTAISVLSMSGMLRIAKLQVTFLILLVAATAYATDYYVDDDGSNETGDGTQVNPWKTISWALIQVSGTGHTIHVESGTYDTVMDGVWTEVFPIRMKDGVSLIGAGADSTVLDADSTATVIRCEGISDTTTRIEGFTVRNGRRGSGISLSSSSPTITGNTITGNSGAGVYVSGGSPMIAENMITENRAGGISVSGSATIANNTITGNSGWKYGGIYVSGDSLVITENTITGNSAISSSGDVTGGIYVSGNSPTIMGNTITDNSAATGSYEQAFGGIYMSEGSSPMITDNVITGNSATGRTAAGGIYVSTVGSSTITDNTITDNTATETSASSRHYGQAFGGIYVFTDSSSTITKNTIKNNSATATRSYGKAFGGIYVFTEGSSMITKNTVTGNSASSSGNAAGGIYAFADSLVITENTITGYNGRGIYASEASSTIVGNMITGNGEGIFLSSCSSTIMDNTITGNNGSGIFISEGFSMITNNTITGNNGRGVNASGDCSIANNTITGNGTGILAYRDCSIINNIIAENTEKGIYISSSFCTITNNTIVANKGSGIRLNSSSSPITNNTIAGSATGISLFSSSPPITNNIVYDAEYGIHSGGGSNPSVTYNLFYSNVSGVYRNLYESPYPSVRMMDALMSECSNNLEGDPLFVDVANGDYRLRAGSPAIDAGDPDPQYNDPDGTRNDIGALHYILGEGPRVYVFPSRHDFGRIYAGHSEERTLRIRNIGTDVLNVSDINCTLSGFLVSHTTANIPVGDSLLVTVTFTPTAQQTYQDTLTISSNDPDAPIVKIALSGEGFALTSDFDGDGEVGLADFFLFAGAFGLFSSSPEFDAKFDLDNSGRIDFDDLFLFGEHFGETASGAKPVARPAVMHSEARLRLAESVSDPMETGTCVFDVLAEGVERWMGYGLRIRYDSEALEFVRAQNGAREEGDDGSVFLVVPKGHDEVIVASGLMNGQVPRSEKLLTRLYFERIAGHEDVTIEVTEGVIQDATHRTVDIRDLSAARGRAKPVRPVLGQNWPNPFNAWTAIPYRLDASGWVRIVVYDLTGRRVKVLVEGVQEAGDRTTTWDARDEAGRLVGSGVYVLRMQMHTLAFAKKLVLMK